MKKLLGALLLSGLCLCAADVNVTGKWSGSFIDVSRPGGDSGGSSALLDLKQDGRDITGTVGPNEENRLPIQKGKIEGDKITLEVMQHGSVMKFDLVVDGDHIKGEANASHDGESLKAKIDVTRAKA